MAGRIGSHPYLPAKRVRSGNDPLIAVVVTVLNEQESIEELIEALKKQTLQPREVVMVDGGSRDGTAEKLQKSKTRAAGKAFGDARPKLQVFQKAGNRSVGRNWGVAKTKSPIIAFTDAGCVPEPNWLAELAKPFSTPGVEVVSGYYRGLPQNMFEKCLVPYVLVMPDRIRGEFFPATRSMALRRSVWNASGGFNEKLGHNEDYEFAHRLKKLGYSFTFASRAIVAWRPRKNLRQAAWMWLRFAVGDVQAGIIRPKVKLLALRYYLFLFGVFLSGWVWLLTIPYLIWAVAKNYKYVKDIRAMFWLPVLQIVSDIMVLFGTLVGLLSRT